MDIGRNGGLELGRDSGRGYTQRYLVEVSQMRGLAIVWIFGSSGGVCGLQVLLHGSWITVGGIAMHLRRMLVRNIWSRLCFF